MIDKDYLNSLRNKMGIYQIRNLVNGKVYVGSSYNVASRWVEHQHDLRKNEHRNQRLQNSFNKYGEDNFVYEVLEIIESNDKEEQFKREQYWINAKDSCNKKKGYNIQSEVLLIPHLEKAVVCLETQEIFNSIKEAANAKGIDAGSVSCCCHKRKIKVAGGLHWRFYEEYLKMTESEIQEVLFDVKSYPFICLDNGKIYRSWRELPYRKGLVTRCCSYLAKKKYATCDGKQYMFLKDYEKLTKKELEEIRNLKPNTFNSGEVICLETSITYEHARKAMLETGIPDTGILNCCYKKSISILGTHWMFKKEYVQLSSEQVQDIIQKDSYDGNYKPVVCLETKEYFKSGVEASSITGVSVSTIGSMCRNGGVNTVTKGHHFMFLAEYEKLSEQEIKNILNAKPKHVRRVRCVETGETFGSVTEAAKSVGDQTSNISKCCKYPKKICRGYHWEYVEKGEKD